jgi:hypothetical protein
MPREKAIMAYGTQSDRLRAAAMAKLSGKSTSEWLLKQIRDQYAAVYGDADPEKICGPKQR